MNEYRIEIWQYHFVTDSFSSYDIFNIRNWWLDKWYAAQRYGECSLEVYKNDRPMPMSCEELGNLGFYDGPFEEDVQMHLVNFEDFLQNAGWNYIYSL